MQKLRTLAIPEAVYDQLPEADKKLLADIVERCQQPLLAAKHIGPTGPEASKDSVQTYIRLRSERIAGLRFLRAGKVERLSIAIAAEEATCSPVLVVYDIGTGELLLAEEPCPDPTSLPSRTSMSWQGRLNIPHPEVTPGSSWRHFEGGFYTALGEARRCSAPTVPYVVYRSCETDGLWVRTLDNWYEQVDRPPYTGPRFVRTS